MFEYSNADPGVRLSRSPLTSPYCTMAIELKERELYFEREVPVSSEYKGYKLGVIYKADFVVEQSVIVELKAIDILADIHRAQLLSYLRLSGLKLGLLINFHEVKLVDGVHRIVNKYRD